MTLKRILAAGACSALCAGGAAAADLGDHHSGSYKDPAPYYGLLWASTIDLWGAYAAIDSENTGSDIPEDTGRIGGSAKVNLPFSANVALQLDLDSEFDTKSEENGDYDGLVQGAAHLSYRTPGYLLGVFGGYGMVATHDDDDERGYLIGAEGQLRRGNFVFYGQVGYFDVPDPGDTETMRDSWFVRGESRYFYSPNQLVSASLIYGEGEDGQTNVGDVEYLGWELKYQQKFDNKPMAWFAAYDGNYFEHTDANTEEVTEHVFKLGLSFTYNADTLLENDQFGTTLSTPTEPLKAAGYTVDVID